MKLLKELLTLTEDVAGSVAAKVYHRDYEKTKAKRKARYLKNKKGD